MVAVCGVIIFVMVAVCRAMICDGGGVWCDDICEGQGGLCRSGRCVKMSVAAVPVRAGCDYISCTAVLGTEGSSGFCTESTY